MGKYMRKGRGVGKMAAMEGSLGVRTRARALALDKDRGGRVPLQISTSTSSPSQSLRTHVPTGCTAAEPDNKPVEEDDSYMELRSRKLGKSVLKCVDSRAPRELIGTTSRASLRVQKALGSSREILEINNPNDRAPLLRHSLSHLGSPVGNEASQMIPAAQISLQSVRGSVSSGVLHRQTAPSASTHSRSNSISISASKPSGILTRNQKQELENLGRHGNMDVDRDVFTRASTAANQDMNLEVEPFFGESQMIFTSANQCRVIRFNRESTPDSYMRGSEAPGSTSRNRHHLAGRGRARSLSAPPFNRANEAPSCSEIEAFFEGAEQVERRRFIERYNFDPVNERPLRGRFEWTSL